MVYYFVVIIEVKSETDMKALGEKLGKLLRGGEVIELIGDVGAGKTTLTKGVARGLSIDEDVQSPSFTISRVYDARDNLQLAHYDFYRLNEAGIMESELGETVSDPRSITVIEWAQIVAGVLPEDRLTVRMTSPSETDRFVEFVAGGEKSKALLEKFA